MGKFLATAGVVVYFTAVLLVLAAALPGLVSSRAAANAAMAAGALRTINTAAATYAQTYKNGFPSDLRVLGSPPAGSAPGCNTADLMDPYMARGEKNGYRFEYRPGPRRETPAENCTGPGVDSYVVIARPIRYEQTGRRSFFTDQDGVIRFTVEDREPTWQDAVVQ